MTDFIAQPKNQALIKLSGTMKNLKVTRKHANFVFTESDQTKMGVIAVAAAAAGMGGQAMSTAASASDMEEAADHVEFELDGQPVRGWVWRSPFREGDTVEIVAEWQGDYHEAYAVARPEDRIVALYPHCSRGRIKHYKNVAKWWLVGGGMFSAAYLLLVSLIAGWMEEDLGMSLLFILGFFIFFALMTFSLSRKWMPFVRLAERIFTAFGWDNPGDIDLVRRSRETRDQPYLVPELDPSIFDWLDGDEKEVDPDPNLPDFLRPQTQEEQIEAMRRQAQRLSEPERTEEMRRIESIDQQLEQSEREFKESDELNRTIKRSAIIHAYGSMYFRY